MGTPGKILVVEDNGTARAALAEILAMEGYLVETAATAPTALDRVTGFSPDVVLTDMTLPGMDGLGFIRRVRESGVPCGLVLMTADQHAINQADAAGVEHVGKPIDLNVLYSVLGRAMSRAHHH